MYKSLIFIVFILTAYCSVGYANGWEHTSIDFEVLVKALNDTNPNVRRRAAESLGFRPQPGATDALIARLQNDETIARVRQEIYAALGRLGEASAVDALQACLVNETAVALRAQCANALANIDSPAAEQLLLQSIDDENLQVRLRAIAGLGNFSNSATVQSLIKLSTNDDDMISNTARLSLGRTRSAAASELLVDQLAQTSNRDRVVVLLQALTLLADPAAIKTLQDLYRQSSDELVKQHALVAMASTRASGSESLFLDALSSENHASRMLGLAALRQLDAVSKVATIVEHALRDSSDLYNREGEQLLRNPGATIDDLQLLNEYLKTIIQLDPKAGQSVYLRTARPLQLPRSTSAALKIAEGFYGARWQSIYGLGYTDSSRAAELVAAAMEDPDKRIRAVATRSMGVLGNSKYFGLIREMLRDDAAEVRWTAARVLGRLDVTGADDALMQSLDDGHAQVRLESAVALGYLKAVAAKQKLMQLAATDSDPRVREAAVYAASLIE